MVIVEILIPLTSNEGAAFEPAHHAAFEEQLITTLGGFSLLPGTVRGGWMDAGDETRIYAVAVSALLGDSDKILRIVEIAKAHYEQLAIFVRYLGLAEVL